MHQAKVILVNGATYEKWLEKISLPKGRLVDTSELFRHRYISVEDVQTHNHGPTGEHSHAGTAFTTWIDFAQAAQQAEAVKNALIAAGISGPDELSENCEQLKERLLSLDASRL